MSWTRVGDTAAHDPRTLYPLELEDADERSVDEVFGFSVRLASQSGAHEHDDTDCRVTLAMVRALAGSPVRGRRLMEVLVAAKVWEPDGTGFRLVKDPNYIHLRAQDEIDRDRIRKIDERNDKLTVSARLRDGDNCRYCGIAVNWRDRKSLRGATWEHVNIANQPTRLDEFVVCCFGCNREPSTRGDLQEPPARPKYGDSTKKFITERLGTWPTKARIAELINGQRTPEEIATGSQRTGKEIAADTARRTSPELATPGQRTDGEIATENPPQNGTESPPRAEQTPPGQPHPDSETPRREPVSPDLARSQIRGLTDPDPSGRVGEGSASPGHHGTGVPRGGSAGARSGKRSPRGKARGGGRD